MKCMDEEALCGGGGGIGEEDGDEKGMVGVGDMSGSGDDGDVSGSGDDGDVSGSGDDGDVF
ncbi:hypothetical protein Tco_1487692, partial [Tanacetum coccineum]